VPLGSMRQSPLRFTGISALAIRPFTSSLSFGQRHRRAGQLHLQGGFPGRSRRLGQRMPWANPILACSVFRLLPHSAGARLCRMTRARKGSSCCHRAVIQHIQEFGIVSDSALRSAQSPVVIRQSVGPWEHPLRSTPRISRDGALNSSLRGVVAPRHQIAISTRF
jgi:hypothetical protein